jgi:DNA primase
MKVDFEQIKRTTDIVRVVTSYGIELKRTGKDHVGLCPFHDDHHPSLHVTPDKGLFRCPSCQATGNVIQFVARKEGIGEREAAVKLLTAIPGVQRGQAVPAPHAPDGAKEAPALLEERAQLLLERALAIYQKHFAEGAGRPGLSGKPGPG